MKKPSKLKLACDLVLGGAFLALAATVRPYDFGNLIIGSFALTWITGAAITLDRKF